MGVSVGRVRTVENPGQQSARLRLERGGRVELNPDLTRRLYADYTPAHTLYFISQGFFPKVFWLGTARELRRAVAAGTVPAKAMGSWPVPPKISQHKAGWEEDMEDPFSHEHVGKLLPQLRETVAKHGRTEMAATMTVDYWLDHMRSKGSCLANRMHGDHLTDGVFCIAPSGHIDPHTAACPSCEVAAFSVRFLAHAAGEWGPS